MLELKTSNAAGLYTSDELNAEKNRAASVCVDLFERREPKESTGWLSANVAGSDLPMMQRKAEEVRRRADALVVVGVGGSNQAARAAIRAVSPDSRPEIVWAGNTLSPAEIQRTLQKLEGRNYYINVIAKNSATLEPGSHFRVLRQAMAERWQGREQAARIIITGTPGSELHRLALAEGYTFLTFPEDIGGRYTAFSQVGLFPMMAAGLDASGLLRGVADMEKAISVSPRDNIAVSYAAIRSLAWKKGKRVEILSCFEPRLERLLRWWIQLFGESEGKQGKGLYPSGAVFSEDLHSIGQYIQEGTKQHIETFLTVEDCGASVVLHDDDIEDGFHYLDGVDFTDINKKAERATIAAHSAGGVPCVELGLPKIDEYALGQLFYFFMTACAISGRLLGVDPFDQPGVEEYKTRMFRALGKQ